MQKLQRIQFVGGPSLLRAGLRLLLAGEPDIEVLGEAERESGAHSGVSGLQPQLLLVDQSMPEGIDDAALADIKRRYPDARMLMIVPQKSDEFIRASIQAGANGCVRKDATHEEYRVAIRSVLQGNSCLEVEISAGPVDAYADVRPPSAGGDLNALTPRERDVLKLVAAGKSSKTIAEMLALSVKTVGKHRANLMAKLDLHNAAGLTAYAMERGLHLKACSAMERGLCLKSCGLPPD